MEIKGMIKLIMETERFESGFYKREFVVTTEGKYPQDIKFAALKEKADTLDDFEAGDDVAVSFDLRGREYNEKYYVDLNAWKVDLLRKGASKVTEPAEPVASEGDLPF